MANHIPTVTKRVRPRSTGFPQVSLEEARDLLRKISGYGWDFSEEEFAGYLGNSTANSGAFLSKLSAFRNWGLVSTAGGRVIITALGKRLAIPEDRQMEVETLREVFRNSGVFSQFYDSLAKGQGLLLTMLANRAVHLGVAVSLKDKFVQSFKKSVVVAELGFTLSTDKLVLGESVHPPKDTRSTNSNSLSARNNSSMGNDDSSVKASHSTELRANSRAISSSFEIPMVLRQVWRMPHGRTLFEIRSSEPLSPELLRGAANVVEEAQKMMDKFSGDEKTDEAKEKE